MRKVTPILFLAILASATVLAQADIPLRNWTVPPYTGSSSGGIHTMVDVSPPRLFIGLAVCRLLDTRPPANNPLDGDGAFAADAIRTYDLDGQCGIPGGADAVSLNFTVTNTGNNPFGHLKVWPANQAEPNVSTLNWAAGGLTVANAAIVALSPTGTLSVKTGNAGADVIIDINGYFAENLGTPQNSLALFNNSTAVVIAANNASTTCSGSCGIQSIVSSGYALYGNSIDTAGVAYGVYGEVNTVTTNSAGVRGFSDASTGAHFGVWGEADTNSSGGAGVFGLTFNRPGSAATGTSGGAAGVRGESDQGYGVLAFSEVAGVGGFLVNTAGTILAGGRIAQSGFVDPPGVAPWSFFGQIGDIGGVGTKSFVEPHPTDASKNIVYIALEGPEAGTYFRGRGKFERGMARIEVPEDFRFVTDPEGLTVQITPIGGMATVGVMKMGLDEIVVQSSRNLEFSYLVQGVRANYKDRRPIRQGSMFVPASADEKMPAYVEGQRRLLIQNGTYRPDGTVNMETAQRLGWDKIWEERAHPQPRNPDEP